MVESRRGRGARKANHFSSSQSKQLNSAEQQALLDLALAGSNEAHGLLLESCRPWMHCLIRRGLPDGRMRNNDADDLTQQACLNAHLGLAKFAGRRIAEYCGWLKKICQNLLATALRRLPREETLDEESLERQQGRGRRQPTPEEVLAALHQRAALAEALNGLPHDERLAARRTADRRLALFRGVFAGRHRPALWLVTAGRGAGHPPRVLHAARSDAQTRGGLHVGVRRSNGMAGYFGFDVTVIVTGRQGMATSVLAAWAAAPFLNGTWAWPRKASV